MQKKKFSGSTYAKLSIKIPFHKHEQLLRFEILHTVLPPSHYISIPGIQNFYHNISICRAWIPHPSLSYQLASPASLARRRPFPLRPPRHPPPLQLRPRRRPLRSRSGRGAKPPNPLQLRPRRRPLRSYSGRRAKPPPPLPLHLRLLRAPRLPSRYGHCAALPSSPLAPAAASPSSPPPREEPHRETRGRDVEN